MSKYTGNIVQKDSLKKVLIQVPSIKGKLSKNCQFHFEEDARLFAIGENILRQKDNPSNRVLYLIVGSSLSSAFMVQGELVEQDSERLESQEMEEGVISDYISSRGMMTIAKKIGIYQEDFGPKDLEKMALNGDSKALKVFETFGEHLGLALVDTIKNFSPDDIIIGGNLVLSYPLFQQSFENTIRTNKDISTHYNFS